MSASTSTLVPASFTALVNAFFRPPPIAKRRQEDLLHAQHSLLDAEALLEYAQGQVATHRAAVRRLEQQTTLQAQ